MQKNLVSLLKLLLVFLFLPLSCISQKRENWVERPPESWPRIALTNHVTYNNGDRYIHSSFPYAGTGFLINTGKDTLAASAKHVLWVARNKVSSAVEINAELKEWVMKPKGNQKVSVEIDSLINEDKDEVLEGAHSSITERDWLVFSVKNIVGDIQPLKPRYTPLIPGEKIYMLSCGYTDSLCAPYAGTFLRQEGMDLLLNPDMDRNVPGSSGSPVIDSNGYLVGVLSSATRDAKLDKNIIVAVSTTYLQDVLSQKKDLNLQKKDYGALLMEIVLDQGPKAAIEKYHQLKANPKNFYTYNLRSSHRNGLKETGEKLLEMNRVSDAIEILACNAEVNSGFFRNFNVLAKAYLLNGDKEAAIKYYKISTEKYPNEENNEAFKELENILNRW